MGLDRRHEAGLGRRYEGTGRRWRWRIGAASIESWQRHCRGRRAAERDRTPVAGVDVDPIFSIASHDLGDPLAFCQQLARHVPE